MSTKPKAKCPHCSGEYCVGGGMTTHLKSCKQNPSNTSTSSPSRATGGSARRGGEGGNGAATATPGVDPGQLLRIQAAFTPSAETTAANRQHLEQLYHQVKGLEGTSNSFRPSTFVSDEMFGCPRKLKLDLAVGHGESRRRSGLTKSASDSSAAQRGNAFEDAVFDELRRSSGAPQGHLFFNMDVASDSKTLTGSEVPCGGDVLRAAAELCHRRQTRVYIAQATLTCNLAEVMARDGVDALSWLTGGGELSKDLSACTTAIASGATAMSPMKPDLLRFDPASADPIAALTDQLGRASIAEEAACRGSPPQPAITTTIAAPVTVTVIDVKSSRAGAKRSHKMQVSTYGCVLKHLRHGQSWAVADEGQVWLDPSVAPLGTAAPPDSFGATAVRFKITAAVDDLLRPWFANVYWPKVGLVADPLAIEARSFEPDSACGMCDFREHCGAVAAVQCSRRAFGVLDAPESKADTELEWLQGQAMAVSAAVPLSVKPKNKGTGGPLVRTLLGQLRQFGPGALRFNVAAPLETTAVAVFVADGEAPLQFAGVGADGAAVQLGSPARLAAWLCAAPVPVRTLLAVDGPSQLRRVVGALTELADAGDASAAGALRRFFVASEGNVGTTVAALHGAEPPTIGFSVAVVDAARCAFAFPVPLGAVDVHACARYILHEVPPAPSAAAGPATVRVHGADVDVAAMASLLKRLVARVAAAYTDDSFAAPPALPSLLVDQHALVASSAAPPVHHVLSTLTEARAFSEVLAAWATRGVAASTSLTAAVPVVGKVVGTAVIEADSPFDRRHYAWLRVPDAEHPLSTCNASVQQLTAGLELVAGDAVPTDALPPRAADGSAEAAGFFDGTFRCVKVYHASSDTGTPCLYLDGKTVDNEAAQVTAYAAGFKHQGLSNRELVSPVAWRRPTGAQGTVDVLLESANSCPWAALDAGKAEYFALLPRAHRFNVGKIRDALASGGDGLWLLEQLVTGVPFAAGTEPELRLATDKAPAVPDEATPDQRAFITRLCTAGAGALSTVLWGPPGTGKTTTLAMGIAALAALLPSSSVIVVAAVTHKAKNEVRGKLCRRLGLPFEDKDSTKTDSMVLGNVTVCFATAYSVWKDKPACRFHQAVLVVDEASQMPLDVAALLFAARVWQRVVVAGDVMQLPPIEDGQRLADPLPAAAAGAAAHQHQQPPPRALSVLRRALARHPQAASGSIMEALLFHRRADSSGPRTRLAWGALSGLARDQHPPDLVQLTASFRSCEPIVGFLRSQLYPALTAGLPRDAAFATGTTLQPFETMLHEPGPTAAGAPTSLRLPALRAHEAREIARHVQALLNAHHCAKVGVVTVHRDQRREIRGAIESLCGSAALAASADGTVPAKVEVDTVEKMQGQEYDAVVVAMGAVRPSFALQLRRLNVAVSRAKRHVCLSYARGVLDLARRAANATADTVAAAAFLEAFGEAALSPVA